MLISQTPLRISFCGGGTDIKEYYEKNEGLVISSSIDKYVFVIIKERFDDFIYINYMKKEIVNDVSKIEHELVRECLLMTGIDHGVEITMLADIPSEGSGLGSSSSLTVGLLNAFYQYKGEQVTAKRLAEEACKIEIEILKKPIGKQDQYIAAYGGLCSIKFCKDESVELKRLKINEGFRRVLGENLMLHYTNITRSASEILSGQKARISETIEYYDKIKQLAVVAEESILNEDPDKLGLLLAQNWALKKNLSSNITNNQIDEMVSRSIEGGATGCKISGAGGGGFLLSYCKKDKQDSFRHSMQNYIEMPIMLEPHGSKIIFDHRRYQWK